MKKLVVEIANEEPEVHPWSEATRRKFRIGEEDVRSLENGVIIWNDQIAFFIMEDDV